MVEVIVKRDEPLERALRRFKKKYEKAGILKEIKRNSYYLKPSAEKRIKRSKARRRMRRAMAYHQR
ncbi:MAG: 30S ribosomal protein S21 [Candidatus Marinimicrobia bacterium]|nr:30S ribosomal protein S21 [Candidatus Neomarinimicrobiota bacterium]